MGISAGVFLLNMPGYPHRDGGDMVVNVADDLADPQGICHVREEE